MEGQPGDQHTGGCSCALHRKPHHRVDVGAVANAPGLHRGNNLVQRRHDTHSCDDDTRSSATTPQAQPRTRTSRVPRLLPQTARTAQTARRRDGHTARRQPLQASAWTTTPAAGAERSLLPGRRFEGLRSMPSRRPRGPEDVDWRGHWPWRRKRCRQTRQSSG